MQAKDYNKDVIRSIMYIEDATRILNPERRKEIN